MNKADEPLLLNYFVLTLISSTQAHILNLCLHELLLVTLIEEQIISEDTCDVEKRTEISSFLKSDIKTTEAWGELTFVV